jgi:hypothetical protein
MSSGRKILKVKRKRGRVGREKVKRKSKSNEKIYMLMVWRGDITAKGCKS